jgi:hypothetical protein
MKLDKMGKNNLTDISTLTKNVQVGFTKLYYLAKWHTYCLPEST